MLDTQLHGKRIFGDTYLTILSYILILTQLILMKVTYRYQILLLSHVLVFMIQAMVKIGENCPASDSSVLPFSKPKLNGQVQDVETTTDLVHINSSKQTSEPSTDTETACEPTPQPTSRRTDTPSTLEINDPTTQKIPQNELSHSRGGR